MSEITIIQPRAGWFADPTAPGQQRWWDGAEWTSRTRPAPRTAPVGPEQPASPAEIARAVESAEAYTELVDLAPPRIDDRLVTEVDLEHLSAPASPEPEPARRSAPAGYAAAIAVGLLGTALIAATAAVTTGAVESGMLTLGL